MFLYNPLPVPGKNWHPIEPENLSPAGSGGTADRDGSDFRLLYEPPKAPNARHRFIPLFADSASDADTIEDGALQQDPVQGKAPGEADSPPIRPEAEPDPKAVRDSAYKEGFTEGEKAGFEAGRRDADEIAKGVQSLLQKMEGLWEELVSTYEEKILELIFRVSERVVCGNAAVDPETAKRVVLDAFRRIPEAVEVTIEIHPEDAERIERVKEGFFEENKGLKTISVLPDSSVGRGGCRLKTRFGEVDATLETRLDAVRQTVMNVYGSKGEHGRSR